MSAWCAEESARRAPRAGERCRELTPKPRLSCGGGASSIIVSFRRAIMSSSYNGVALPADGARIEYAGGKFQVPENPILPFIEGDGTGRDIWRASRRVFDAAVQKAYSGKRRVAWYEVFAGEKAFTKFK